MKLAFVVNRIETEQAERIAQIADRVGEQSAEAIDRALRNNTAEAIGALDQATERSAAAGREMMRQLRDQLAKVNELTGNLENRIAHARDRATEDVDSDFSRRVALISESLNSNAIDIIDHIAPIVGDRSHSTPGMRCIDLRRIRVTGGYLLSGNGADSLHIDFFTTLPGFHSHCVSQTRSALLHQGDDVIGILLRKSSRYVYRHKTPMRLVDPANSLELSLKRLRLVGS